MIKDEATLKENARVSQELGCVDLEGYLTTLEQQYGIKKEDCEFRILDIDISGLVCPQPGYAQSVYHRIASDPTYLEAPILVVKIYDNIQFYLIAGNNRARFAYNQKRRSLPAIVIYTYSADLEAHLDASSALDSEGGRMRGVADLRPVG